MTPQDNTASQDGRRRAPQHLTSAGKKILSVASQLFYEQGIRAVGVETIAEESGFTKKTLYDCFGSKEDLIVAYLRARDDQWRSILVDHVDRHGGPASEKLLATFCALRNWTCTRSSRGCAFVNASAELPEGHPGLEVGREQKAWFLTYLEELAARGGAQDPSYLAAQMLILHEGACVAHSMHTIDQPFERTEEIARILVENAFAH